MSRKALLASAGVLPPKPPRAAQPPAQTESRPPPNGVAGASRVLLGTAAYRDLDLLDLAIAEYGDRVMVSIDARGGMLAGEGWTESTEIPAEVAVKRLGNRGVRRFVYSSIDQDGTLAGPDLDGIGRIAAALKGTFIYSGGVASLEDLERLVALRQVNLTGVVVGNPAG